MAVGPRVFFDTSVLPAGLIELGEGSRAADQIRDDVAGGLVEGPLTAWHCCLEFYSVATRLPAGLRLEPETAQRLVVEEILERFDVRDLPPASRRALLESLAAERVAGGRVYDAHIAEVARLAGAGVIVTENRRHFASVMRHGLRVLSAEEFVAWRGAGPACE